MNNEEKILSLLERMDKRLSRLESDMNIVKNDVETVKEDTEAIRTSSNTLLEWAEGVELVTHVKLFPEKKK